MIPIQPVFPVQLRGVVSLPASKSISARALVMSALAGQGELLHLSDCDDTRVLQRALDDHLPEIDILAAGTAMRFSTAYFATRQGEAHIITGSDRMKQRPVKVLVDALRELGADIDYVENEGYPPLRICGKALHGGTVKLPANVSSQYISALLMMGPALHEGLKLELVGQVVSRPYIEMTVGLMKQFGADVDWISEKELFVRPKPYTPGLRFSVEPDWSGASYWYEMVALTDDPAAKIVLPGLSEHSLQGDSVVARLFSQLGVQTTYADGAAILTKQPVSSEHEILEIDFTTCPDLAQTLVVTCALKGQPFRFSGLQSLRIKETDRISALQCELKKIGITVDSHSIVQGEKKVEILEMLTCQPPHAEGRTEFSTYDDHRMAMAFAPVALKCSGISIAHPEVVSKSYPSFWEDLRGLGIQC